MFTFQAIIECDFDKKTLGRNLNLYWMVNKTFYLYFLQIEFFVNRKSKKINIDLRIKKNIYVLAYIFARKKRRKNITKIKND